MFDAVQEVKVKGGLICITFPTELNTNGVVVPKSVATTLKVWLPWAGTLEAKVTVYGDGLA